MAPDKKDKKRKGMLFFYFAQIFRIGCRATY